MSFSKPATLFELRRGYALSIIFYGAVASAIVDIDVDLCAASIQRILQELADHIVERSDDDRRLEFVNNISRKLSYGHGTRRVCRAIISERCCEDYSE